MASSSRERRDGQPGADNYIGTDISGTKAVANALAGVDIIDASSNTIGGTTAGAAQPHLGQRG